MEDYVKYALAGIGIPEELYDIILQNSKKIIEDHLVVDWL